MDSDKKQANVFIRGDNPKSSNHKINHPKSKIVNQQANVFICGDNPKSQIANPKSSDPILNQNLPPEYLMPAQSEQPETDISNAIWYLGIDFGTTGVSAVLLNYSTNRRYPIYWSNKSAITPDQVRGLNSQVTPRNSGNVIFRLPAITYSGSDASELLVQLPETPLGVGSVGSTPTNKQPGIFLQNFKFLLNIGIPYYCPKRHEWEPTLRLPSQQLVSLYWVRRALQALLATLTPKNTLPDSEMMVGAVGLEAGTFRTALRQLEGVVLGYPTAWGDTYHFNLREAVLEAKLVRHPEQIFFLEDAIAPIVAALPSSKTDPPKAGRVGVGEQGREGAREKFTSLRGGTLVINAGATTTELALVDLPDDLQNLTHSDFSLRSWFYAGNAIDQDIFCQLLYPQMSETQHQQLSLGNELELPLPGQADKPKRDRLALLLQRSSVGQALLKTSGYLKLILQHKDEFTLDLGRDRWTVRRQDLEVKVLLPFIQQLNRELNALLIATKISDQAIHQVFCIGGTTVFKTLQKWIQQKLPNATIIQEADSPTGSWVATGLATLPLYPKVLNRFQQQYSDYFLLLELLRAFAETPGNTAERPYRVEEIVQQLERRGLNTAACYERLLSLVQGQLPPGLVPSIENSIWLSQASKKNPQYSTLTAAGLFSQEDNQLYRPNLQQQQLLRQYLELVLSGTYQKFEEPLIVKLGL